MARQTYRITGPKQLACLASAVRQEIVDTVQSLGKCSIADIARSLGRPADGLYYHVRELLRVGLLLEHGVARNGRREEAIYTTADARRPMQIEYRLDDPANRKRIGKIVDGMLNTARQDFAAGAESGHATVGGKRRNLWAARNKGWLNADELAQVNELLQRLAELLSRPKSPDRRKLHVLTWIIAPVDAQPPRRG